MKTLRAALLYVLPITVMMVGLSLISLTASAQTATPPTDPSVQQPTQQPDSTASASEVAKIFTGKIVKAGDKLVLTDAEGKKTYQLDDQQKAKSFLNKNVKVTGWSQKFVAQADKYCALYETPYVMIVSRAFPKKEKDFCVVHEIPIVCPSMAVALARVMREGIVAIGRLRLTGAGRDHKAHELLHYLVSDKFETRFKGIADSVDTLREQQKKERNWHENSWETQSSLHDRIDKNHREIDAQLETILRTKQPVAIAARA